VAIGEGAASGGQPAGLERVAALAEGFLEQIGPFSEDEVRLIVPAALLFDLSFITWQLRQPVYIQRALACIDDLEPLWEMRGRIEDLFRRTPSGAPSPSWRADTTS
jgi:hypothetical protein